MPKKWVPKKKDLKLIEDMKYNNASDASVARALGIASTTYRKYKNGYIDGKTGVLLGESLKRAEDKRRADTLKEAKDSLRLLINGATATKTKTITRSIAGEEVIETHEESSKATPNVTATIFALCNLSEGEYNSINNVQNTTIINQNQLPDGAEVQIIDE